MRFDNKLVWSFFAIIDQGTEFISATLFSSPSD